MLRALNTYLANMSISILNLSPTSENLKFVFSHVKGTMLTSKFTPSSKVIKGLKSRFEQIQPILLKKQLTAVDTALNLNKGRLSTLEE